MITNPPTKPTQRSNVPTFQRSAAIPLLAVALAFLLRTPTLDWQSFWVDEVQSAYFVGRPLMETVKLVISPEHNGPLYYLLLWFWQWVAGSSDFCLRYLSDLCSVLTVAALWQLARTWFNRRVAGFAALLIAIAPFAVWFAQEARTYALHMLLATLCTLFLAKALRRNRWYLWLGYGISLNLLAYSHYFGAFTVAVQGLLTLLTLILISFKNTQRDTVLARLSVTLTRHNWRRLRSYILTMLLVALPYLPLVRFVLRILPNFQLQDISRGFVPLHAMLAEYGAEYVLRTSRISVVHPWRLLAPLAGFLLFGLGYAWRRHRRSALWLTGLLLLPTAIFYPFSFKVPIFSPKYLSAAFPFFILTLALALEGLRRRWKPLAWAALGVMVTTAAWANVRILTEPLYQRSDWRAAARYLEQHIEPGDVVVGYAHYATERMLLRYYNGVAPVLRFKHKPYEPEAYYLDLRDKGHHTMWLVLHQDQAMAPGNRLRDAAAAMFPNITGIYPNAGNIAILGYSLDWKSDTLPASATTLSARFENGLALAGYRIDTTSLPPGDKLMHPPSNWIHVTTYWQVQDPAPAREDFTILVHLVGPENGVWGGNLERRPDVFDFEPPANWQPGDIVEAHYDVNLNPVTPPGHYSLVIRMNDANGERVPLDDGSQEIFLHDIEITK